MAKNINIPNDPYRGLIRVSCIINSIHDYHQLLTTILQITKEVLNCDAASLMLYEKETDDLRWHVALGDKAAQLKEMGRLKLGQGIAGWVAQNRKSTLVVDANADQRFFREVDRKTGFRTRSVVCVPLVINEKLVGVLQALNPLHKNFFDEQDLEIFEAYGAMAATAIEKNRWQETALQQQKMQQELEVAQEIQSRFLVQDFEKLEEVFQFAFYFQPALQIGGDFYDVQKTLDGAYAIILGDVTGKGVPAALVMAQLLSEFRYRAPQESDPGKILAHMNAALNAHSTRGMFATAWCALIRPQMDSLLVQQACAGHLPPFQCSSTQAKPIPLSSGLPLGLIPDNEYLSTEIALKNGELLCAYTDGLTEERNQENIEFGTERMKELLSTLDPHPKIAKDRILQAIHQFGQGASQRDDITFILCSPK